MPWQPAQGTQPLSPFDHQVAGQSSMLRYDKTTVCKPLIAREHFVYKSLPPDLAEFTPEYRGEIEVQLIEEDGYIQLYGLCVDDEAHDDGTAKNHHLETANVKLEVTSKDSVKNRSTVRLLRSGSYEVNASTNQVFYTADSKPDQPHTHSLNPWSLKNHKRLLDKMRKSEHSPDKIHFILLKNVVADFRHPCILDLKIGSRLHGDDASSVKVASQSEKCRKTTSSTLGVRLCGMQVYQVDANAYHSVDKFHGRTLDEVSFRHMLYDFLHNGTRFRSELIQPIVSRLSELIKCLEGLHSFRFYASSLLIIYDGDVGVTGGSQEVKVQGSQSGLTPDLISADNTIDHVHPSQDLVPNKPLSEDGISCKEIALQGSNTLERNHQLLKRVCPAGSFQPGKELGLQGSDTQDEHQFLSGMVCHVEGLQAPKEVGPLAAPQPTAEHPASSEEGSVSVKTPAIDTASDSSSVNLGAIPHVSPGQHPAVPDTFECGVLLAELPASNSVPTQAEEEDLSKSTASRQHSDTPDLPLSTSSQKTDSIKQMLNSEKYSSGPENSKIGDTLFLQNNHRIQQVPHLLDVGLGSVCHSVSSQDTAFPVRQTVPSDLCKHLSDTDNAAEFSVPSVSSSVPTETCTPVACHTPSAAVDISKSLPSVTGYGVTHDDLIQIPQVSLDLAFNKQSIPEIDRPNEGVSVSASLSRSVKQMTFPGHSVSNDTLGILHSNKNSVKVDVKMIDFAHTTHEGFTTDHVKHTGPDTDYILGLRNLLNLFQGLLGSD